MADRDYYKPLIAFAQAYSDALAPLNQRTLNFFESDSMRNALLTMVSAMRTTVPADIVSPAIQETMKSISQSYKELIGSYDFGYTIGESLRSVLANIQVNSLFQISQYAQTVMIHRPPWCQAP